MSKIHHPKFSTPFITTNNKLIALSNALPSHNDDTVNESLITYARWIDNLNAELYSNLSQKESDCCEFSYITTPIGNMLAIFYQEKLCLLEYLERKSLVTELNQIIKEKNCHFEFVVTAQNEPANRLQNQLDEYFAGERQDFELVMDTIGTDFQKAVWNTLQTINYGTTISYQTEAEQMGKPTAMRAVANANGKNKVSIIIPCHRVIRKSGDLGGYGGGLWRKRFLLNLESSIK